MTSSRRTVLDRRLLALLSKLDVHMKEVLRGATIAFIIKAVAAAAHFGFTVLLTRLLGPYGAGMYFQAFTLVTIAAVLGKLGLPNSLVRFTAASAAVEDWAGISMIYHKAFCLALCSSICAGIVLAMIAPWIAVEAFSEPRLGDLIRWMCLAVVPVTLSYLYAHLLKGLRRIAEAVTVESLATPCMSMIGTFLLVPHFGVHGAVSAFTISATSCLLLGLLLWRNAIKPLGMASSQFRTKTLLQSSIPLFWVSVLQLITHYTSTLMLGIWRDSSQVGIFSAANRTATLISFVLIAVNSIAAPKFAALFKQGDLNALRRTAQNSAKLMALVASLPLLVFLILPGWVMSVFGPQFVAGKAALSILSLGQFVNVVTGSVGFVLIMSGHETVMRNITTFVAVINLVANLVLIPSMGLLGAAIATAITLGLQNLLAAEMVWRHLGIWTLPLPARVRRVN